MFCIFCYTEYFDTGQSPAQLDLRRKNRLKICQVFYSTIQRVLGVQPKCALGKDALESCCNNCLHVINNYCKLAFQTQCLQLRLNWQTEQILSVIKMADSKDEKRKKFLQNFINPEDIPVISILREEIVNKGNADLRRKGPHVVLERINHVMRENQHSDDAGEGDYKKDEDEILALPLKISAITSLNTDVDDDTDSERIANEDASNASYVEISHVKPKDPMHAFQMEHSDSANFNATAIVNGIVLTEPKTEAELDFPDDLSQGLSAIGAFVPYVELSFPERSCNAIEMADICQHEPMNLTMGYDCDRINSASSNDTEHDVTSSSFECHIPSCGKSFDNESSYQWHQINHEGRYEMVNCPDAGCDKGFLSEKFLRQHIKIHNDVVPPSNVIKKKWSCDKCNKQYTTKFSLQRHSTKHHPTENSSNPIKEKRRQFIPGQNQLNVPGRKHERTVSFGSLHRIFKKKDNNQVACSRRRRTEFPCPVCEKLCPNRFKLNEHFRSHSGDRPFSCAFCTRRFASKSNLKRHARLVHKVDQILESKSENLNGQAPEINGK